MFIFDNIGIVFTIYVIGCIIFFIISAVSRGFFNRNMDGLIMDTFLWFVDVFYTIGILFRHINDYLVEKLDKTNKN